VLETPKDKSQDVKQIGKKKTIKGNDVVRNGESGNKALYIETTDGEIVLKLESEVEHK